MLAPQTESLSAGAVCVRATEHDARDASGERTGEIEKNAAPATLSEECGWRDTIQGARMPLYPAQRSATYWLWPKTVIMSI